MITGVPTKIGALLVAAAGVNLAAMAIVAFFFGALLGTGLPPAPTYIITALVIAPPMIRVGRRSLGRPLLLRSSSRSGASSRRPLRSPPR